MRRTSHPPDSPPAVFAEAMPGRPVRQPALFQQYIGLAVLAVSLWATGRTPAVDLSHVPQINETKAQRDERMQWFRDAKFGMFIHWGPCSVGQKDIGWGRKGNRPWDINRHGPRNRDPVHDNYYKKFNPTNYNADQRVKFAKASGMKYMVIENCPGERRTEGLILLVSDDGKKWEQVWSAKKREQRWLVTVTGFHSGIEVSGRPVLRYLKVETKGDMPRQMQRQRFTIYCMEYQVEKKDPEP